MLANPKFFNVFFGFWLSTVIFSWNLDFLCFFTLVSINKFSANSWNTWYFLLIRLIENLFKKTVHLSFSVKSSRSAIFFNSPYYSHTLELRFTIDGSVHSYHTPEFWLGNKFGEKLPQMMTKSIKLLLARLVQN